MKWYDTPKIDSGVYTLEDFKEYNMRTTPLTPAPTKGAREILAVGLNPAFQSTLHMECLRPGHVNRASRKCNSIGGKGQNFAIACAQYGESDKVTVFQQTGGMTGTYICAYLEELNIEHVTITVGTTTRTCTTILDKATGSMTELIEPSGRIDARERVAIEAAVKKLIVESSSLEGIALCGTLPPGLNGSIYSLIAHLKPAGCTLLIDAYQNAECLDTGKIDILKVNAEESRKLANVYGDTEILEVGRTLLSNFKIPYIAITDGPQSAYLFERRVPTDEEIKVTRFIIPMLQNAISDLDYESQSSYSSSLPEATGEAFQARVLSAANLSLLCSEQELLLNPLGAGDTCSAIFLLEFLDTKNAALAFQHGLAAASASCLSLDTTSHFDMRIKDRIFEQITSSTSTFSL